MAKQQQAKSPFPFTLKLDEPVMVGGENHTSITLRRPKARDWKNWSQVEDEVTRLNGLIVDLSGWTIDAIDDLDADIHVQLVEVARDFFDGYRDPMEMATRLGPLLATSLSSMVGHPETASTSTSKS